MYLYRTVANVSMPVCANWQVSKTLVCVWYALVCVWYALVTYVYDDVTYVYDDDGDAGFENAFMRMSRMCMMM